MQRNFPSRSNSGLAFLPGWLRAAALLGLACAAVWANAASPDQSAGAVSFVIGEAKVRSADGSSRAVARGDSIAAGQTLLTGDSGHIHVRMVDGAFVSVRPKSRFRIEEYHYDARTPANSRIKFVLEEGVARSITGRAGEAAKENYRLNTPLAAIGIRGTDFVVQSTDKGTRVSVHAGAIVMSPLSADCLAAALGPCNSATTRVLTAAMRNAYLELHSRNEAPLLVPAEKALDAPSRQVPARPEEPAPGADKPSAKAPIPTDTREPVREAAAGVINAQVSTTVPVSTAVPPAVSPPVVVIVPPAPEPTPPVLTPPVIAPVLPPVVVVPPPAIVAQPTQFWWGRWSPFIAAGEEAKGYVVATDANNPNRVLVGGNDVFGMRRLAGDVTMPSSGVAKFQLMDSEAYYVQGKALTAAQVSSPSLTIDFGGRRYETELTLTSAGQSPLLIQSAGKVNFQGILSSELGATTTLSGSLSKDASQAGYAFQRNVGAGVSAVGVTRWQR